MKQKINKREVKLLGIALFAGLMLGWLFFHSSGKESAHMTTTVNETKEVIYTCSMHPQIRQNKPGVCPICAMDLIPVTTVQSDDENTDPNEIQMSESALALASVQTTTVGKGIPKKNIQLLGKVMADERRISLITSRFGGRLEKMFINFTGQQVKKGAKLGTIYSPELINAQKELLEAAKFKNTNPSFYKAARTKLKLLELTEEQISAIETDGEPKIYFEVLSPISGFVTKKYVTVGDYVSEGTVLFEVIDLSKVWIMFDAYESDLPWIQKGDGINFTLQSIPGKTFSGKIRYIDPFIDAKTRVAGVRVDISNKEMDLKPEMFATGILVSSIAANTNEILIPKTAILWTGKRAVVYIKVPHRQTATFIYREIVLGPDAGNFYVVKEGLFEGEVIAVNGVFKVDAAAQLAGKPSMMNPSGTGAEGSSKHNHGGMEVKDGPGSDDISKNLTKETTFKVSGNCEMCKTTIETAAKSMPGVMVANWNIKTKELYLSYNENNSSLLEIHKAIARSGYDTEKMQADNEAYKNLPACCQYTRE